jgi:hypothetical protein
MNTVRGLIRIARSRCRRPDQLIPLSVAAFLISIGMGYSSQIETVFSGPSVTSTYPPHNGLAVGPNYIVMVEGSGIEWTDLAGGSPTLQSTYDFFSSLSPTGGLYDPRCIYDSINQRYIVIMQSEASGATISDIDIAVSKDSNPNDGWYFSQLNTSLTINGQLTASDRPMLSIDGSNIYITAPQFDVNDSGAPGTESWVIGDTAGAGGGIYNGGTLTVTANQLIPASQGIFAVAAGNNGKTYYASNYSNGSQIVVTLETYDVATNTFGPTSTISLGNIDQGGTYTARQLGTSRLLDAGDKRIASMVYANGFLYAVAEMMPIGSAVPLVHWFKINVSNPNAPTLVAQGDISGATIGTNVGTFNPSIAVDASGNVIINFTASGPNMYPGDYYVFQGGRDPTGSFSVPILYQASTGFFDSGNGCSVQRWGVNSSATVDPNKPNSFWISNEYVANGWWQTSVAQVAIQNPAIVTVSSIVASGTAITSGTGDLDAGQVVTLRVNFSAAVTVNTADSSPKDGAGNTANLSGATNYKPAGTLQIDTVAPTVSSIVASAPGITNGSGNLGTGQVVTLTVNCSEPVTVNTTGGSPTLTLNDGGSATYTGGSGSTALTFSYTVAAGRNTPDLVVSSFNLNGATVKDGPATTPTSRAPPSRAT